MNEYHKIQTLFKRDMGNSKRLIEGDWTIPEFQYLAGNQWVFTEKVDGMNIRVMLKDGTISFGGKTDNAQIPVKLYERLYELFVSRKDAVCALFNRDVCLYGEGYGPKIQKGGGAYRDNQDFVLFDILIGETWMPREFMESVGATIGLDVVPVIGTGTLYDAVAMAKEGICSRWGNFYAEGIVARPAHELKTRTGHRIITKVKTRDFGGLA